MPRRFTRSPSPIRLILAAVACCVAGLPGCRVKTPPNAAEIKQTSMAHVVVPEAWVNGADGVGLVADNWLSTFSDAAMTAAVREAIAHNADLGVAAARVEQAIQYARLAGAKLYPSVDLIARGGGKMSGDNSGLQGAALTVSWELDLWGRVRYGRAAASADAAAAAADFEFAKQSIAAAVARAWFIATEAGLQLALARETVRSGEELVRLAETRVQIGAGDEEDVAIARSNLGTSRDALGQIELARSDALRSLEILVGRYPAAVVAVSPTLPPHPGPVPPGLPSELLERRPDVVAAERRVAAAFHRVHEAKAARLPAIALTTGVSSVTSDLFVLADRDNPIWNFGANLLAPIFRGGELNRRVDIRTAEQAQAVAAYAAIGLRAFGEVERALAAETSARDRERLVAQAVADDRRALEIVTTRFQIGSTDMRFVTDRQLAVSRTSASLVAIQTAQRIERVNLHLALGGSF